MAPSNTIPPASIRRLRNRSSLRRGLIIRDYLSISAKPRTPPYLRETDPVVSHIMRSELDLAGSVIRPAGELAYTRGMIGDYPLNADGGALTEVCIGVMADILGSRGELQVAAGFFSSMVACMDDLLDKEASYDRFGERLLYVSHAYRDLMDMALAEEVRRGEINLEELRAIRSRLFDVIKTLISSEEATDPRTCLYRKSCGDRVIGVLFPTASAGCDVRQRYAEIGRLTGEAGQLIDDAMDLEYDRKRSGKNHIIMSGTDIGSALGMAEKRITKARGLARGLGRTERNQPVSWILDALSDLTGILGRHLRRTGKAATSLLNLSRPLTSLLQRSLPADQFLLWF